MFIYLLPVIHLSLLIFGLVISENSTNITVQVNANGSDTPSCIQNNTSCKTMLYVLDRIVNMSKHFYQNTSITVYITCNQIIELYSFEPYKFVSSYPLSIRLIGHNNTSIAFKQIVLGCLIIAKASYSELDWAWIGFTFFTYSAPFDTTSLLGHVNIDTLAICNCKIMNNTVIINDARNIVIDRTEFGTKLGRKWLCSSVHVKAESHSTSFKFSNNNFSNCKFPYFKALVSFDIRKDDSNLTIINCTFTEVIAYYHTNEINMDKDTRIIFVTMQEKIKSALTINESHFTGNSKVKVLTVHTFSELGNYYVSVLLHGLVIINNTATSALVEINSYTLEFGSLNVNLSNLLVDANNVGSTTDWSQAVSGLESSSVFSFSKVTRVTLTNSKFTNNHGTPLKFKSVKLKTSLFFAGNNTFSNNNGVFGGACNIHNVMFQMNDEGKVIFENNKGIYGGALYLATIAFSMTVCKLKFKFIDNKAVTSGNSVYFATSPQ